jgi:hypothetical protein
MPIDRKVTIAHAATSSPAGQESTEENASHRRSATIDILGTPFYKHRNTIGIRNRSMFIGPYYAVIHYVIRFQLALAINCDKLGLNMS